VHTAFGLGVYRPGIRNGEAAFDQAIKLAGWTWGFVEGILILTDQINKDA
jgi:hypothetical protein